MEVTSADSVCGICKKSFRDVYTLKRHIVKFHPNETEFLPPVKSKNCHEYKYSCGVCNKKFYNIYKLNDHNRKEHHILLERADTKKCPLCESSYQTKGDIMNHFELEHNVTIERTENEFASIDEFNKWKSVFEVDTLTKFIVKKTMNSHLHKTIQYDCHRSGFYVPKGNNKRHLKTQGTLKINGFCPAEIKLVIKTDGTCRTQITNTHVGHQNEIQHVKLTPEERRSLAMKLAAKIPFDSILDEIRDTVEGVSLKRIHLLNKQDLYNVERSFNLSSTVVRHPNDAISVDSWIHQMKDECVRFYKPQDTTSQEYPELKSEDFVLILMNSAQIEMLQTFGSDCVCVDGTHGLNSYNFEMHTLLVLDDLRQGFPCAFLISNRSDEVVLKIFFSSILQYAGAIQANVFMSDMADAYHNAWTNVMGIPKLRLYCSWHVDKAWRKNLSKISNKEKQTYVYKMLRVVLQETDEVAFSRIINKFYNELVLDDDTKPFADYFKNYMKISTRWAYCYRLHSGLNTNMHLERMHGTIKDIYLGGKKVKRLDKSLHAIMRFVRDKLFDRLILLNKGKITAKVKDLRKRHQDSLMLTTTLIVENGEGWDISSTSKATVETYQVFKNKEQCNCQLVCLDCRVCLHTYSCSCIDSSVKWNMCKHIHLLCRYLHEKIERGVVSSVKEENECDLDFESKLRAKKIHSENILSELGKNNCNKSVETDKEEVIDSLYKLIDRARNINSPSKLNVLKKLLAPISPTMNALDNPSNINLIKEESSIQEPHNKKIQVQRRLFSTQKPRKKNFIMKPSSIDIQVLTAPFLLTPAPAQEDNI